MLYRQHIHLSDYQLILISPDKLSSTYGFPNVVCFFLNPGFHFNAEIYLDLCCLSADYFIKPLRMEFAGSQMGNHYSPSAMSCDLCKLHNKLGILR